MLRVKSLGSYKASHLRTGGQHCLSHKNLSFPHVLTGLIPHLSPPSPKHLPGFPLLCSARPCCEEKKDRGQTQDFPHPVTDVPGRCSRTAGVGRGSSPTEEVAVTGIHTQVWGRIWRWWRVLTKWYLGASEGGWWVPPPRRHLRGPFPQSSGS